MSLRALKRQHPKWKNKRLLKAYANKHPASAVKHEHKLRHLGSGNVGKRRRNISTLEHQRRSEGAKRGWIKRRLRFFEPLEMLRSTWGTGLSDKNVPFSFTFYAYSEKDLDSLDMAKCEEKFINLIDRWIRAHYPSRNYNYGRGEADGWIQPIVRREENTSLGYDKFVFKKWIFEINSNEEDVGELAEIL